MNILVKQHKHAHTKSIPLLLRNILYNVLKCCAPIYFRYKNLVEHTDITPSFVQRPLKPRPPSRSPPAILGRLESDTEKEKARSSGIQTAAEFHHTWTINMISCLLHSSLAHRSASGVVYRTREKQVKISNIADKYTILVFSSINHAYTSPLQSST